MSENDGGFSWDEYQKPKRFHEQKGYNKGVMSMADIIAKRLDREKANEVRSVDFWESVG